MKKKTEIEHLEEQLTALLKKKSYICTKKVCRGKYRGLYDYSLKFQDGSHIWISCGRKRYEAELRDKVEQFIYFRQASALGLSPVKLVRLELIEEPVRDY
jgi:hypothetical protein